MKNRNPVRGVRTAERHRRDGRRRAGAKARPQTKWRPDALITFGVILAYIATAAFTYTPMISWFSQRVQSEQIADYQRLLSDGAIDAEPAMIKDAREYNSALSAGAVIDSFANVARGVGSAEGTKFVYGDLLNVGDNGLMGRLRIPSINVDLPIYHGTDEDTLLKGVGHLQGTSLPIGGESTRTVLTAHRGLASAELFTHLDKMEVGDIFTITVLDKVYAYQAFDIRVISPEDSEAVNVVPGEDEATLVTCTPLGINSHRILVTGKRVDPVPDDAAASALETPTLPHFPWWLVVQVAVVIAGAGVFYWAGRPSSKSKRVRE